MKVRKLGVITERLQNGYPEVIGELFQVEEKLGLKNLLREAKLILQMI